MVRDLSKPETMTDWLADAEAAFGPVDILVNNAGVQVIASSAEVDVEEGERSLALNLVAPLRLSRSVLTVYPGIIAETEMAQAGLQQYASTFVLRHQPTATAAQLATAVRRGIERLKPRVILPRINFLARMFPGITRWVLDRFSPKLNSAGDTAQLMGAAV